ncbi:MAG: hypothetical protein Q8L24_02880 [bacterium]|nr:hypothetical protein [bacterium]
MLLAIPHWLSAGLFESKIQSYSELKPVIATGAVISAIGEYPDAFPDLHIQLGPDSIAVHISGKHPTGLEVELYGVIVGEVDRKFEREQGPCLVLAVNFLDRRWVAVVEEDFWFQLKLQLKFVISRKDATIEFQKINFCEKPIL